MKKYWRKKNAHNSTVLVYEKYSKNFEKDIKKGIVQVGRYSYGKINFSSFGNSDEKLIIGNFVSIAGDVLFLLGGNHNYETVSTYPFKVRFLGAFSEAGTKGPIYVEDDVWIGQRSMILSGVRIGKGAVIAAGTVVEKDIPPYAIVAGNPARIVKYRFSEEIIDKLMQIDFSFITPEVVKKNKNLLAETVTLENVCTILNVFTEYMQCNK